MKEEHPPMNKTRKVALRKHRAKARKDEAKRKALTNDRARRRPLGGRPGPAPGPPC